MSINLKCAACGHEVPFQDGDLETESICPGCEVLLRRRSLEDQMAIPVSMALPDEFEPADLGRVPKHSRELIHRYQKSASLRAVKTGDPLSDSNLVLAKAIERLAFAIEGNGSPAGIQKEFVSQIDEAGAASTVQPPVEGSVPVLNGLPEEPSSISANGKTTAVDANGKALPVGSPVLVRREAAAQAHRFQRQTQAATDIKGPQQSSLVRWVEGHPFVMMLTGLTLLIALVVMTWILMNDSLNNSDSGNTIPSAAMIGEGSTNDPDFDFAEREARGFLNAVGLNAARPYIFRADSIGPKLEKFYRPLPDPANYSVELTGRQRNDDRSVYYYQVTSGEVTQPLVVLQEQNTFRVFWEYGAGVGDVSWTAFVDEKPETPVLMRAFLQPGTVFDSVHSSDEWRSWLAENWDGSQSARVFSKRGTPEDRRLTSALTEHPVKRKDSSWVMAQVRLKYIGTSFDSVLGAFESAEVVEVPLGSWLPEEFVVGNTFYSRKDQLKGNTKDNQGLQKRSQPLGQ